MDNGIDGIEMFDIVAMVGWTMVSNTRSAAISHEI